MSERLKRSIAIVLLAWGIVMVVNELFHWRPEGLWLVLGGIAILAGGGWLVDRWENPRLEPPPPIDLIEYIDEDGRHMVRPRRDRPR